jgi:hypothetical protein
MAQRPWNEATGRYEDGGGGGGIYRPVKNRIRRLLGREVSANSAEEVSGRDEAIPKQPSGPTD